MATQGDTTASPRLTIDVWADVVCPWCYLGEHRLSQAIEKSGRSEDIELRVHTFQLHPDDDKTPIPTVDYLSGIYGVPESQARSMEDGMARTAHSEGLAYEVDRPAADTLDMLRVVQYADEHGLGWETMRAIQSELFGGNQDAFEHETIVRIAERVGLSADDVRDVLATDRYAGTVRADHQQAIALGARGVPFTVLGERLGIPGAVDVDAYASAIEQAWEQVNG